MAPSPAAPYDPMSDDIMQREDKDLKTLFREYHGFSIHVENVNQDDIKAGKAVTARVLFTRDADTAAKRSDAFFATLAEKAGGEKNVKGGFVSGAASFWHAELPKEVQSRGQALAPVGPVLSSAAPAPRRGVSVTSITAMASSKNVV